MTAISKVSAIQQWKFTTGVRGHLLTPSQNFIDLAQKLKIWIFQQFYLLNKNADPAVKISPGAKFWQSYESKLFVQFRCNPFSRFYETWPEVVG